MSVRLKDISATGVALLVVAKGGLSGDFLLGICPKGLDTHWMLCCTRRTSSFDGICTVVGATWEKVLQPGQDIQPGNKLSSMLWLDVAGSITAEDPFTEYFARPRSN